MTTINVASDFSRFPGGRYRSDGKFSGEEFRQLFLEPALNASEVVDVVLDGVAGLPASFLEEAFGGLLRAGFTEAELRRHLRIIASAPRWKRYVSLSWDYIKAAGNSGN